MLLMSLKSGIMSLKYEFGIMSLKYGVISLKYWIMRIWFANKLHLILITGK